MSYGSRPSTRRAYCSGGSPSLLSENKSARLKYSSSLAIRSRNLRRSMKRQITASSPASRRVGYDSTGIRQSGPSRPDLQAAGKVRGAPGKLADAELHFADGRSPALPTPRAVLIRLPDIVLPTAMVRQNGPTI